KRRSVIPPQGLEQVLHPASLWDRGCFARIQPTQRGRVRRITAVSAGRWADVGLIAYLIILFFVGLFVGAIARLLLPGPDPMGIGMTVLVGICGTFSAGLFSWYVLHRHGGGLILSVLFSMLVVWLYRRSRTAGYRG